MGLLHMTPDMIASVITMRWAGITTELVRRKRLDPEIYKKVVSTLAHMNLAESVEEQRAEDNS